MIEQQYYRLGELERSFGLSLENLRYMVENDQIRLLFKAAHAKYLIGLLGAQNQFSGFGSAHYSGFICITKADQLTLITKHKVHCSKMWLLQQSKIMRLDADYPYKHCLPNQYVQEWIKKDSIEASDNVWAIPYLTEHSGLGRGIVSLIADLAGKQPSDSDAAINKLPEYTLTTSALILTHDDICVTRGALIRLGLLEDLTVPRVPEHEKQTLSQADLGVKPKERTNDFHELLACIISAMPELTAKGVWTVLEKEVSESEGDREFDKYNILRDMSGNELYWMSRHNNASYFKFSSIGPTLSNIKKSLNLNKN